MSDIFMGAIEEITAAKKESYRTPTLFIWVKETLKKVDIKRGVNLRSH